MQTTSAVETLTAFIHVLRKTLYPIPFTALFLVMPQVLIIKFRMYEYATFIVPSVTCIEHEFK